MASTPVLSVVLDSNVLVSLLVFDDPRYTGMTAAWRGGSLRVLTGADCAAEFKRVLAYPRLKLSPERQAAIYYRFESGVQQGAASGGVAEKVSLPLCTDPDDQKFLELAAACAADCLVTGDRELLKLAKLVPFAIVTADALEARIREWE